MREDLNREKMHKAINSTLSGLNGDPWLFQRISARAKEGETKVKKKMSAGLVLAIILILIAAAAVAVTLLTRQEIVEQVAVPMAIENDSQAQVQGTYTTEQLAELVRTLNENGFTLEENNQIMQYMQNGRGYYEEEVIMEICRQAFGGNYYTWTLEEQDWFDRLMVDIGWYETYESSLPGEGNMTYEQAEAFAFAELKKEFGDGLDPTDRTAYQLSRQFYHDTENGGRAVWNFSLEPRDIEYGQYSVSFEDGDPEGTTECYGDIPDWSAAYSGDDLMMAFYRAYGWSEGKWPQHVWQQLHEMMLHADLDPEGYDYQVYRSYQLTSYPEPAEGGITREEAVRAAREALKMDRAAMDSAVFTEYEGERTWMVGLVIYPPEDDSGDEEAGTYVIAVDSATGRAVSLRKSSGDDNAAMPFVPEAAYEKAREGILKESEYIRLAAEAIRKEYPDLDMLNEDEFRVSVSGRRAVRNVRFISNSIRHGNASASVSADGTVTGITADTEALSGDNILSRYRAAYGYFGNWGQETWVMLAGDLEGLEPEGIEGKLLKMGGFPEESSVSIDHVKAQELAAGASGKRTAEINTCVLIDAEPHPVWKLRVIADDPEDQVIELDAETGEVLAVDVFKTDYTPQYVLYSLEKNWRKLELETHGPVRMAKRAVTYAYGDLWLDFPEPDVENPDEYGILEDGLTIRFIGRWKGMKSYTVELDGNGYVLRCEETDSDSVLERAETDSFTETVNGVPADALYLPPYETPAPREDGMPWVWRMDFAPEEYWDKLGETMEKLGISAMNLLEKEAEWYDTYGYCDFWPQEMKMCAFMLTMTPEIMVQEDGEVLPYPVLPSAGGKSEEEIRKIAEAAMHAGADDEMGKERADRLEFSAFLWNTGTVYGEGELKDTDGPCWVVQFEEFEDGCWNARFYMLISEDGEILTSQLMTDSNG